ncbi:MULTISPECIES: PFL_4669 family integrating conjugative element protein [Pectobacteriaceae]|uniref:TIGR03761 family integrating conjugative element protein n=1 Tax=Affinibrenneria salicis TaxID=2590031 RepID=A0A5J5FRE5_9GAMM|nr:MULTISPECIES: TIGR03761 family integrating conjugative element protein [Pectobacteriaceae]MEE3644417.1 TIGR03761 family integrating conjugative element protein [Brenneria sp. L3_3C_1]MEE3651979.1 TIGR03761 family integrating conjugative element protein [Brenneria sp. HEZEL_4_2_4]MEE3663675.1 TIGR03761 family integrating conjugative element protein [Brenneria sp. g21c3]KAA8995866.1 TIGR03761 family integrating conjugative element protein [Affinibrenneria salicis]MBJ7223174.1 TIGR03761 family
MNENEQQSSRDNYRLTSGPLRSAITIELHTHLATQLWQGRQANPEEDVHGIIGMPRFLNIMNILRLDAITDNPYADIWMLRLEERLLSAREEMNALIGSMDAVFAQIPEMMTVESCLSIQPARFPVFAASQLGFIAVYLLTDFDKLMRNLMLANHMALINRVELNDIRQRGGNLIRSIFVLAQKYRRIPVTRQDIRDGNARAQAAEELAGPVPDDIFKGSRRSAYAPPLRFASEDRPEPVADIPASAPDEPSADGPDLDVSTVTATEPGDDDD